MNKDAKKKLGAEKLEKREAPFMPITYQDDSDGGGGATERNTVSRRAAEDVRNPEDGSGGIDRPIYDRPQR